ncbi:MAG: bifunctional UDP-N-acetylglucosamine diphosphorylase/glucosamine-1-phosphate N-acetyltransferase GlmU [Terracidiphilus sp.]
MSSKQSGSQEQESKLAVVIMAADRGARLKSRRAKALHQVGGRPMIAHVVAAASRVVESADVYVVVGPQADLVQKALTGTGVHFIEQAEHSGTSHAVLSAMSRLADYRNVLMLSGDMPLIRPETIMQLRDAHRSHDAAMTVLTAVREDPKGYRRVLRHSPQSVEVDAIVDEAELKPGEESIHEVSAGAYAFKTSALQTHLGYLAASHPDIELCLSDMARNLRLAGRHVAATPAESAIEISGIHTLSELAAVDAALRAATANRLMAAGVTIFRPETCVIDADVEVEADTVIEPFVQLLGRTRIGAESHIRSYAVIENCTVGNRVIIRQSCVLAESSIADGAEIGPFARMRPGCEIGEDVHIGNFVEIKKSKLHKGVKAGHLAYLGDSEIGAKTNIGAGVITCNYDGAQKHLTRIGEGVFVGSDSTLVAPLTVEDGAYIGAGSCITKNVPAGSLAVGRAHQIIKEGWAAARRARNKERERS